MTEKPTALLPSGLWDGAKKKVMALSAESVPATEIELKAVRREA